MTGLKSEKQKGIGSIRFSLNIRKWADSSLFIALAVAIIASACLFLGFSQTPRLYTIDYGQYERILADCGLDWTEEDIAAGGLQFERPVTSFAYKHFSWTNLLTPNAGNSIVYLVSVVRLFTEPFGKYFSVDGLALVSAVILVLSITILTLGMHRLFHRIWIVPLLVFCFMAGNGNFCAMFRGLYPEGAAIVFSLLFAGVTIFGWSVDKKQRKFWILPVMAASVLMLNADAPMILFLPFVAAADIFFLLSCRKDPAVICLLFAGVIVLLAGLTSSIHHTGSNLDFFSNASLYESVFNTMVPAFGDHELMLLEFGLDKSYAHDVGKSFYEAEDSYAHNPRDEEAAKELFSKITTEDVVTLYLLHPDLLLKVIRQIPVSLNRGFENARNRELADDVRTFHASRTDSGYLFTFWQFLPHSYVLFVYAELFFALCGVVLMILQKNPKWLLLCLFSFAAILYLPFDVVLNGYSLAQEYILFQIFLMILLWMEMAMGIIILSPEVRQWFSKYGEDPYVIPARPAPARYVSRFTETIVKCFRAVTDFLAGSHLRLMIFSAVISVLMLCLTFLPADHPVCINNGDFGRMMAQLDLTWPGNIFFDAVEQMGHSAIEEYGYLRPWDVKKLTPLKPTFSLYWFASIVRLMTEPFGKPFSTWLLAWVMGGLSVISVLVILNDLYPILKKWSLAAALALCTMLYSETYLTWYDGLFGEGCILLSILLTLMCAVHLCRMPVSGVRYWKKFCWLFGLFLSLNIMVSAKSQMLLTLPGAILIFVALCIYQRPYRYDFQALLALLGLGLCLVLALSAFTVYQSERTEESVSQKHTMWQAFFYGIFMIADDPIGDMEAMGIDTAMAPDIGKYVQFEDPSLYVYAPLSEEAEEAFYNHVSMFTILKWYLTHPTKLWYMMDHAAKEARALYTGFRVYNGQNYSLDHEVVDGLNFWPGWRAFLTPASFLGYVIFYAVLLFILIRFMLRKDQPVERKMLCVIPLFLIVTGVIQYPMSVIGNGFVDNQKQMFGFSLCHDLLMAFVLVWGFRYLSEKGLPHLEIKNFFAAVETGKEGGNRCGIFRAERHGGRIE